MLPGKCAKELFSVFNNFLNIILVTLDHTTRLSFSQSAVRRACRVRSPLRWLCKANSGVFLLFFVIYPLSMGRYARGGHPLECRLL